MVQQKDLFCQNTGFRLFFRIYYKDTVTCVLPVWVCPYTTNLEGCFLLAYFPGTVFCIFESESEISGT